MKTCTLCGESKPETAYYAKGKASGQLLSRCKPCDIAGKLEGYRMLKAAGVCPCCKGTPIPGRVYCEKRKRDQSEARKLLREERRRVREVAA